MKLPAIIIRCPDCESFLRIDPDDDYKVTIAEYNCGKIQDEKEVSVNKNDEEQSPKKPSLNTLDEELNEKSLSQKALEVVKNNKLIAAGAFVTAACATPIIMGFGSSGIVAGSIATVIQSGIGDVAAGSAFATMQSLGATGTFVSGTYFGSGIMGAGALNKVANKLRSKNIKETSSNNQDNNNEGDSETKETKKGPSFKDDGDDRYQDQQDEEEKSPFQDTASSANNHSTGDSEDEDAIICPSCGHRIVVEEQARLPQ